MPWCTDHNDRRRGISDRQLARRPGPALPRQLGEQLAGRGPEGLNRPKEAVDLIHEIEDSTPRLLSPNMPTLPFGYAQCLQDAGTDTEARQTIAETASMAMRRSRVRPGLDPRWWPVKVLIPRPPCLPGVDADHNGVAAWPGRAVQQGRDERAVACRVADQLRAHGCRCAEGRGARAESS